VGALREYGAREQTRTDHLRQIAGFCGWRPMGDAQWKELEEFLFARAMEHDSPKLLFRLACEFLLSGRVSAPVWCCCSGGSPPHVSGPGRRRGFGSSTCYTNSAVRSWICCWCRTLSSSDGQRFPVKGKSITARHLSRYFAPGQGISTYTHVSDQHSAYDSKVIVATAPESHYVLDGILGNETDLPISEHATDTHGATLANFALFDLVGKQLSPRIRDLGKITLYRTGPKADFEARYRQAGALLTRRLNTDLITSMWDDLLRVAASVKGGHATAALVVGKLCSSKRQQNTLTSALKEYGALRRTLYAALLWNLICQVPTSSDARSRTA
jgi:hypothetical protein